MGEVYRVPCERPSGRHRVAPPTARKQPRLGTERMRARRPKEIRIVITHPAVVRVGTNLLLLALLIAALFTLEPSDSDWGLVAIQAVKYSPIIAAAASAVCLLVSVRGIPVGWPLLFLAALSLWSVSAGFFASVTRGDALSDTFVGRGLCVIAFAPAYMVSLLPGERRYFGRHAGAIIVTTAAVMIPVLVAWRLGFRIVDRFQIYHEEVLYFSAAAGFVVASGRATVRRLGGVPLILACILTIKLTGFGLAVIVATILWLVETAKRPGETYRPLVNRRLLVSQIALGCAATASLLASVFRRFLPSGSREVRLQTYGDRFEEFVASPIWGSMFVGSPIMQVGWLVIPSHSDFMDLLAFGGGIGATLFYAPAVAGVVHGLRSIRRFAVDGDGLGMFGLAVVMSFLFESAFNPVLGQPKLVVVYWTAMGVLLADRRIVGATRRPVGHGHATTEPAALGVRSPVSGIRSSLRRT